LVVVFLRDRKTGELYRLSDALGVDEGMGAEAFAHGNLGAFDVIGAQARVRRTPWHREELTIDTGHIATVAVTPAHTPYVADVMSEGGEREVEPVFRRDVALDPAASQNVLADQGHKGCVLCIMIERVAEADPFEDKAGPLSNDLSEARLAPPKGLVE